jgi:uncharacterized membrane protein (Fun14 family)
MVWTGIDALNIYSNIIINKMNLPRLKEGKAIIISAEVGSVIVGATQFIGAFLAYFTVRSFGRVTLLVWGHLIMGLLWLGVGLCTIYEYDLLAMVQIALFLMIFSVTEAPVIWIYCAEALNDTQFGVAQFSQTASILLTAYITEYLLEWLKPEGLFFLFSASTLLGGLYIKTYLKET